MAGGVRWRTSGASPNAIQIHGWPNLDELRLDQVTWRKKFSSPWTRNYRLDSSAGLEEARPLNGAFVLIREFSPTRRAWVQRPKSHYGAYEESICPLGRNGLGPPRRMLEYSPPTGV